MLGSHTSSGCLEQLEYGRTREEPVLTYEGEGCSGPSPKSPDTTPLNPEQLGQVPVSVEEGQQDEDTE